MNEISNDIMRNPKLYLKNYLKMSKIGSAVRRYRWKKSRFSDSNAVKALEKYYKKPLSNAEKQRVLKDMIDMGKKYRFDYNEYFLFDFMNLSEKERLEFIPDLERIDILETVNLAKNEPIFDDKYLTYRVFSKYFQRDVCCVLGGEDSFLNFMKRHDVFVVKPFDGGCGSGVQIISQKNHPSSDSIWEKLMKEYPRGFIAEEKIRQHPDMAKLHPSSVNTVRIPTLRMDDRVEILHPFMRIGRGDMIVDNAGAGGICGLLNLETGEIISTRDEDGNRYVTHPETGEPLIGFKVPHWQEALELVRKLAYVLPSNRYTGWDLALGDTGWQLVEANARGQFIGWQITSQKGFRKELEGLLKELGYTASFLKGL